MQTTDIITNKSIGMDKERTGMLLLSKEDIKSVITMKDMIEADKQAFKMVVNGTVDTPLLQSSMENMMAHFCLCRPMLRN